MPFTSTMRAWFNRTFRTSLSDPLSAGVDSEDYRGDEDETPARTGSASPTTAPAGSSATSPAFAPAGAAHRSRDFARLDEGDAPETGIAGPKKGDAGYGHNVALGVMDRWKALAGKNPYTEIFTGLSAAFGVLQDLPNSRLGPKAATSLRVFANTLPTLMAAANDAARALETALANLGTDKKTDKRQEDAARTLEAKLTALDTHVAKLGTVIQESIVSLQGEVIKQANSNVGKNYANLHPEAAAFFEDAAKVAKGFTSVVGVLATASGHPHIGIAVKGALTGAVSGVRAAAKFILTTLDKQNPVLVDEAAPLLPKDSSDALTLGKVTDIAGYFKTAASALNTGLSFLGVDLGVLDGLPAALMGEITAINAQATAIQQSALVQLGRDVEGLATTATAGAAAPAGSIGIDLEARIHTATVRQVAAANAKLEKLKAQMQTKLTAAGKDYATRALRSIETRLRGARTEESLDIAGTIAGLEAIRPATPG